MDLLPFVTGDKNGMPHERLYWRKLECAAMRDGQWKLIRVDDYGFALYNLTNDIAEKSDLAAQEPEKVERLKSLLESWERDKMDPLWQEGPQYIDMRLKYHTERFKTGEIDPKVDAKAFRRKLSEVKKK